MGHESCHQVDLLTGLQSSEQEVGLSRAPKQLARVQWMDAVVVIGRLRVLRSLTSLTCSSFLGCLGSGHTLSAAEAALLPNIAEHRKCSLAI